MAKFFQISLDKAVPVSPPVGPLTGLQPMKRDRAVAVMAAQDRVAGLGRRVLASQGLKGQSVWRAATDPITATSVVTLRADARLTPGCFLELWCLYIPSGWYDANLDGNNEAAIGGVEVSVQWTDATLAAVTDTFTANLPASLLPNANEPTGNGELWNALRELRLEMRPENLEDPSVLNRWTKGPVKATVTLKNTGSTRIVDACLYEVPHKIAIEADDAGNTWASHGAAPEGLQLLPDLAYPWQRLSETTPDGDARFGTWQLQDTYHAQALRTGPLLVHWTSYAEDSIGGSGTEDGGASTTSATFVGLANANLTAYDATKEGWSLGCHARDYPHNDDNLILRGLNGDVPVRVSIYAKVTAGTGTFRMQTAAYSWIDVPVTSTSFGWFSRAGYLRCGVNPEDTAIAQAFFKVTGGATFSVRDVQVSFEGR